MVKPSENLIERLRSDDRYKKMIDAAPEESREKIRQTVDSFLKELGAGLDELQERLNDPEVRKAYLEEVSKRKK